MGNNEIHAVTGAFGFSGKYIAHRLLQQGTKVRTLTNSPNRDNNFDNAVEVSPFYFDNYNKMVEALQGVSVLYNTYWVRFNHKTFLHSIAVDNTLKLFTAAKQAGVKRIVHTSITNPSENSPLEYFSGKGILERELINSGISYSILRPAVLFGNEDILINNIAWTLRKLPVFGTFGNGNKYRLQPIYVDDFAKLAVEQGKINQNTIINAIGPETFTYKELVKTISQIILNKKRPVIPMPDWVGFLAGKIVGAMEGDVMVTKEEIKGLKADLLCVDDVPPVGVTKLTDWVREHVGTVGKKYASELARRKDRTVAYKYML